MPTKRRRCRAGLLDRPIYLTFADEVEGDEYCRRVEALLDRGIVPPEFLEQKVAGDRRVRAKVRA